jgi:ABC-type histidine transport system ATPase subunit
VGEVLGVMRQLAEEGAPGQVFSNPSSDRLRAFLRRLTP